MKLFTRKTTPLVLSTLLAAASAMAQQPAASNAISAAIPAVTPAVTSTAVTTPGGTAGLMPVWTGTSTIGNSIVYQTANGIGIGRFPNATLDIGGTSTFRGSMGVSRAGDATTSAGAKSFPILMQSSVYNSSMGKNVLPYFQILTEAAGNNTASPGATLNFMYYSGVGAAPVESGLYFNGNGTIHFAPSQTFPITTGARGPVGPEGPAGPAGPSCPTGPAGPSGSPVWTSNTNLVPFTTSVPQYGTVIGNSDALTSSDYYGSSKRSVIFPRACTLSNLSVNLGYESLSSPFVMETDVLVNGNIATSCSTGFATGYSFNCISSGTYSIPAGSQVVLQFSHTGTNPANVYPQVTFSCS
jgi:hypothetical protein